MHAKSSHHAHKSSDADEKIIRKDLREIKPFEKKSGRMFSSFIGISHDPVHAFDEEKFNDWVDKHKNNILMHYPAEYEQPLTE